MPGCYGWAHERRPAWSSTASTGPPVLKQVLRLEASAFQTLDAVEAIEAGSGDRLAELRADGGATVNAWLMQFQADMLDVPVVVPEVSETTALGEALLAGVGCGAWTQDHVVRERRERSRYEPRMGADQRAWLAADWRRAVARARDLAR